MWYILTNETDNRTLYCITDSDAVVKVVTGNIKECKVETLPCTTRQDMVRYVSKVNPDALSDYNIRLRENTRIEATVLLDRNNHSIRWKLISSVNKEPITWNFRELGRVLNLNFSCPATVEHMEMVTKVIQQLLSDFLFYGGLGIEDTCELGEIIHEQLKLNTGVDIEFDYQSPL